MIENSKIRVAFLTGSLGLGGSERQLFHLSTGLDKSKFEPVVISLHPSSKEHWEERLIEAGIRVIRIAKGNPVHRAWRIRKTTQQFKVDIVHSFHFFTNAYAALSRWNQKISVIGNIRFWPSKERISRVGSVLYRWLCLYRVNILLCNSEGIKRALEKTYRRLPTVLAAPNGVAIYPKDKLIHFHEQTRKELRSYEDEILIGFVGRLDENKDPFLLLNAFNDLVSSNSNISLVFVGDGPLLASLAAQIDRFGLQEKVSILGSRSKAHELIPAFDVLCLPSKSEGMPNSVMEASSAGIPIVASNVGGLGEIVIDKETGYLFVQGDSDELKKYLKILIADPSRRSRMGEAGRVLMQQNYSLEQMIMHHEQLYNNLAERQFSGNIRENPSTSSVMNRSSR